MVIGLGVRRELRRLRRRRAAAGHAPLHLPRGGRRRRGAPRERARHRPRRQHRRAPGARERAVGRRGRDAASTRTTCSRRSTSSRARSPTRSQERVANGRLLEAAFGPAATEVFRRTQNVHIVACGTSYHAGQRGALLHRADLQAALRGRHRERVPLPQPAGAGELAVRDHLAVGRDRRHAGGAAAGQAVRLPLDARRSATCRRARWCASRSSSC